MITATDINTNKPIRVQPVALLCNYFSEIAFCDGITGRALWQEDDRWILEIPDIDYATRVTDIYSEDEDEWFALANRELKPYGFRLGDQLDELGFVYDLLNL